MLDILFANSLSTALTLFPIVMILVEILKGAGGLVKRWIPLFSVLIGIFVSWVASAYVPADITLVLFSGAISGAMTCGIWDIVKVSILGK